MRYEIDEGLLGEIKESIIKVQLQLMRKEDLFEEFHLKDISEGLVILQNKLAALKPVGGACSLDFDPTEDACEACS